MMKTETAQDRADYIIDEAMGTLQLGGRVRIFCPGGPIEPISIEYTKGSWCVDLETSPGRWAKLLSTAVVGWEDLDDFDEATQSYRPA